MIIEQMKQCNALFYFSMNLSQLGYFLKTDSNSSSFFNVLCIMRCPSYWFYFHKIIQLAWYFSIFIYGWCFVFNVVFNLFYAVWNVVLYVLLLVCDFLSSVDLVSFSIRLKLNNSYNHNNVGEYSISCFILFVWLNI